VTDETLGPPPSETSREIAGGLARAALSAVPIAGGPLAELFDLVIEPGVHRRYHAWLNRLAAMVDELRARNLDLEHLADNERFLTAFMNATTAAARTHEDEKLRALQNALTKSALALSPDEHLELMFLRFVDEFTALHLQLLAYLREPTKWYARNNLPQEASYTGSRARALEGAFPELRGREQFYLQVVRELATRGLARDSLGGMVTPQAMWDSLTTPLGNQFLDYISGPSGSEA